MVGREFYRGKCEMTDSSHVWTPDLGDHLGDKLADFGDEIWDLKGAGIYSISLRHECAGSFHVTSRPPGGNYIRRTLGRRRECWSTGIALERERLWSSIRCAR
ncbi:hypothetical protein AVEN_71621-1 [Araneus ventricosus]|uniref:Uncharacterized protein n=1 Tax=Araneus ventricosus TaxID=182803 RepID=A0A4Y2GD27_ARAVE|nr:hypothetical protein AVEN_71621-1 [Araneus ventricosus]